jgi:putative hemolysin
MQIRFGNLLTQKDTSPEYNLATDNLIYFSDKKYIVKLAENLIEVDEVLKLRFEVFNLELKEGLDSSFSTLRDEDKFDRQCHHLLVIEKATNRIVGTYRLQTLEEAKKGHGFYSSGEFNLNKLGRKILRKSVEVGRACIDKDHRNSRALFLLWKGIAQYMFYTQKRYLFGCCSISSQDPVVGKIFMNYLERNSYVHERISTAPVSGLECYPNGLKVPFREKVDMPSLMDMYLRYGAKVCGPPAIDRAFKTIDFFIVLDTNDLDPETREMFYN